MPFPDKPRKICSTNLFRAYCICKPRIARKISHLRNTRRVDMPIKIANRKGYPACSLMGYMYFAIFTHSAPTESFSWPENAFSPRPYRAVLQSCCYSQKIPPSYSRPRRLHHIRLRRAEWQFLPPSRRVSSSP